MGAESLDKQLEPFAEIMLIVLAMIALTAIVFLLVNALARRQREKAHTKLSASKRTKDSHIDLFGAGGGERARSDRGRSGGRPSRSAGIDLGSPGGGKGDTPPDGHP